MELVYFEEVSHQGKPLIWMLNGEDVVYSGLLYDKTSNQIIEANESYLSAHGFDHEDIQLYTVTQWALANHQQKNAIPLGEELIKSMSPRQQQKIAQSNSPAKGRLLASTGFNSLSGTSRRRSGPAPLFHDGSHAQSAGELSRKKSSLKIDDLLVPQGTTSNLYRESLAAEKEFKKSTAERLKSQARLKLVNATTIQSVNVTKKNSELYAIKEKQIVSLRVLFAIIDELYQKKPNPDLHSLMSDYLLDVVASIMPLQRVSTACEIERLSDEEKATRYQGNTQLETHCLNAQLHSRIHDELMLKLRFFIDEDVDIALVTNQKSPLSTRLINLRDALHRSEHRETFKIHFQKLKKHTLELAMVSRTYLALEEQHNNQLTQKQNRIAGWYSLKHLLSQYVKGKPQKTDEIYTSVLHKLRQMKLADESNELPLCRPNTSDEDLYLSESMYETLTGALSPKSKPTAEQVFEIINGYITSPDKIHRPPSLH